jgi:hypothetical protein
MENKRGLLISGGGSWGAFGGGTLARINGDYDIVVGMSTGSLLAPLTALKEWELLKTNYTTLKYHDIIDHCWYKPKLIKKHGRLSTLPIIITLLLREKTVYTSNVLKKTIDKFFPENFFQELRLEGKEIIIAAQNYAEIPSVLHYFSSNDVEYLELKDWMWCGANFPYFTSLVKKSWQSDSGSFHVGLWNGGGLSDFIGVDQLMMKGLTEIDIILHRERTERKLEGNPVNNLIHNITTSVDVIRYNIELEYFYERIKRLNRQGAKVNVYWLPRNLNTSQMFYDQKEMLAWWEEGYDSAFNEKRLEIFPATNKKF